MKFAICQELFEDWDWERQCRFVADVGYTGIEVAPFSLANRIGDVSAKRRQELSRQAEDHGLSIIGLHWLLAKTQGLHLTSADPAIRKATVDYLIQLGEVCADLGGELMVFGSPKQRSLAPGMTHEEGLAHAEEIFRAALPTLADRGVRLCLEPLTPNETNFLNTCAEAQELIDRIDHPNLCLHQRREGDEAGRIEADPRVDRRVRRSSGALSRQRYELAGSRNGRDRLRADLCGA